MSTPTPAPSPPLRNSYWVIPGKVLAGEHPTAATVEATRERLQRLMDAGVECFIDLTEPGEIKPYDTEIPLSIEYLRKPIKDHGTPSQRAHMAEILDCIHDALQSGRCVYVHCRAGIGRTGTVIGCLLVERGLEGESALDELNRLWQQCERSQNWPSVPETDDQAGYVRKWKARAVFAEELSLASVAARNALAGKSGSPSAPAPGAGSAAGANAILGGGQAPGTAGPGVGIAPDAGMVSGGRGSPTPTAKSDGASADSALSRLGLPLLDDDDDGSSDFATFNRAQGISSSTAPAGGTAPGGGIASGGRAPPVASPGDWPSFGKQGAAGARPAGSTGQGAQSNTGLPKHGSPSATRQAAKAGVSGRSSAPADTAARDSTKGNVAARQIAADDYAAHNAAKAGASARGATRVDAAAPNAGASTPDSAAAEATARGLATRSGVGDPATVDSAARGASTRDSAAGEATHGLATRSGVGDPATADSAARGASTRDSSAADTNALGNAGVSTRDSAATDTNARGASNAGASTRDSGAADTNSRGAPNAGPSARDSALADAIARGSATPGLTGDTALADIAARTQAPPVAPGILTSNTTPDDDPLADPGALSAARSLRDRFLGALVGLAVGDAVSAATQFRKPGTFTPVGDMIGGGPFDLPRGGWSDDTAMALCLADSLLERDGFDVRDQMDRYRRWQQEGYLTATGQCVGITASTARAIAMSAWRRGALFGSHDPAQLDPEPLSRVAPAVMFFFAASGPAVEQATEAARTTCQAPAVLDSCRCLARAMYAALSGQPKAVILEKAAQAIGNTPGRTATGISASAALTAAVSAFGATANFRDAVLYAANLGGDSDVISAVCGQLAGAYYSVKAIPTSWHNGLMQKDLIIGYADRLLAHAMLGLSG